MTTNNLTEQWKKGELEEYKKYYCKTKWFEDVFQARCYNKDTEDEWWALENEKYKYNNIYHTKDIEILAPVPSFDEWQPFTDPYFRGLTTKDIAELAKKSIRLTTQHCEDNDEILKLKALLCQCEAELGLLENKTPYIEDIIEEIKEVLK